MLSLQDTHAPEKMTIGSDGSLASKQAQQATVVQEASPFITPSHLGSTLGATQGVQTQHYVSRPSQTVQPPIGLRRSLQPFTPNESSPTAQSLEPLNAFWGESLYETDRQDPSEQEGGVWSSLWASRQALLLQCWEAPFTQHLIAWVRQPASMVLCGVMALLIVSSVWVKETHKQPEAGLAQHQASHRTLADGRWSKALRSQEEALGRGRGLSQSSSTDALSEEELAFLATQQDDMTPQPQDKNMLAKAWAGLQSLMPKDKQVNAPLGGAFDTPDSGGEKIVEQKLTAASQGGQRLNPFQQLLIQKKIEPPPQVQQDPFVDNTPVNDPSPQTEEPVAPPPDSMQGVILRGIIRHRSGDIEAVIVSHQGRSYTLRPGKGETINQHKVVLESASDESASFTVDGFERKELSLQDMLTAESAPTSNGNAQDGDAGQQPVGYPGAGQQGGGGGFDPNTGFIPPGFTFRPRKGIPQRQGYRMHSMPPSNTPTRGYTVIKLH